MIQTMFFSVKTGSVVLQWPDDIEPDCFEFALEALAIQLKAIRRRAVTKRSADLEYESWFPPTSKARNDSSVATNK